MSAWFMLLYACSFGFLVFLRTKDDAPSYLKWITWGQCIIVGLIGTYAIEGSVLFSLVGGVIWAAVMYGAVGLPFAYISYFIIRITAKLIGFILGLAEQTELADKIYDVDHYDTGKTSKISVSVNMILFAIVLIYAIKVL